ncbi:U32 family peptidase [Lagierella sp.]|uniref:U32 family peptidase n=1 Tax=Lagierella sp. TaxID=2849657 RepID=UPI002604D74F|nr:U32 family peptidase [Lagierella sp.]
MKDFPEILAPVGDMKMLEAAIKAGASGVYLGGNLYSARAYATNFDLEELKQAVILSHRRGVRVYITVNTLFHDEELEKALNFAIDLYNMDVDGVIIQDLGLFKLLKKHIPDLDLHASTQMNINNYYGAKALQELGFKRVVLARETPIEEIEKICKELDIEVEVFVHGSLCVSCSGQCLMSSYLGNRSGNRGRCAQPCRMDYKLLNENKKEIDKNYGYNSVISPKDLSTIDNIEKLQKIGVKSFKIEGRMKKPEYVYNVVKTYYDRVHGLDFDENRLRQVALRGYTRGTIFGDFGKNYIELNRQEGKKGLEVGQIINIKGNKGIEFNLDVDEMDILLLETEKGKSIPYTLKKDYRVGDRVFEKYFFDLRLDSNVIRSSSARLLDEIKDKEIEIKQEIFLKFIGRLGEKPELYLEYKDIEIREISDYKIMKAINSPISEKDVSSSLKKLGNTDYFTKNIEIDMDDNIFIPVKILNSLRRGAISQLDFKLTNYHDRKPLEHVKLEVLPLTNINNGIISVNLEENNLTEEKENPYGEIYTENLGSYLNGNYFKMPRIIFSWDLNKLAKELQDYQFKGFLINNIGDIQFIKENFPHKQIVSDYGLNVLNIYSFKFLESLGLERITLSTELNLKELNYILNYVSNRYEIIVHGPLISMIMKHCPFSILKNCVNDENCEYCNFNVGYLENERKDRFKIIRKSGYSELYHTKQLLAYYLLHRINFVSNGSVRVIDNGTTKDLSRIYFKKINGKKDDENVFDIEKYTTGHFEKGIE